MSPQFKPSARRLSNSCLIKSFYSSVKVINGQRQAANAMRISKYMQRQHGIKHADCIAELELCVRDGLLHFERTVGKKGSKRGALQERYVVPSKLLRDGHDWYCFECHKGGEVICCSSCHRVFHISCIKDLLPENSSCYICAALEEPISLTKEKLNRLLEYLLKSLKDMATAKLKKWTKSADDELAMRAVLYNPVDLNFIHKKILDVQYSHWLEFASDVKTFLHNIIIYFGENSSFTQPVFKMIEYCKHDIKEMEKCADCYEASNDRSDKLWFCKPCKPLHSLVFAKLDTFPFWPAKVIEQFGDKYDVRFFGSGHTRSVVHKDHVRPIPLSIKHIETLPKYGNSLSWEKAMNELTYHLICIGPQVRVSRLRLPLNCREKNSLQKGHPLPQRKRKMCGEGRNKKIRCLDATRSNITQNMHKTYDTVQSSDKESQDDDFVDRFNCDDTSSLQVGLEEPELAKDVKTPLNIIVQQTEMQEVDDAEKTDAANLASPCETDSDSVSISELHEEIDIKDEYIEENEYQSVNIASSVVSMTNVLSEKAIPEKVEASSSRRHTLVYSVAQETGTHKTDVPKKNDAEAYASLPKKQSNYITLPKLEGITIMRTPIIEGNDPLNDSTLLVDRIQKSQNLKKLGNSAEKHSCSKDDSDCLEILAESIIVKEEPPCLNCSGRDMIPRKEAEKLKAEAVAQATKHYLAIIARLEEQCGQKKKAEKQPGSGI